MRPDGSDLQLIYSGDEMRNHVHVSPDGTRVVFSEFNQDENGDGRKNEADLGASDISIMNIDGSGYQPIAHRPGFDITPTWSPDGEAIIYSSDRENVRGFLDLFVFDLETQQVRNLTGTPDQLEADPHWQGNTIVFVRIQAGGGPTVWIMNDDGSGQRQLTRPTFPSESNSPYAFGDYDPKLSPDGSSVAFERHVDDSMVLGDMIIGDWDIMLIDLESGDISPLVDGPEAELMPAWSPDGGTIAYWAFINDSADNMNLYLVSTGGGSPRRLLQERADLREEMPDWYVDEAQTRLIFSATNSDVP